MINHRKDNETNVTIVLLFAVITPLHKNKYQGSRKLM